MFRLFADVCQRDIRDSPTLLHTLFSIT